MPDAKNCTICKKLHPVTMFHKQSGRPDGLGDWCKPCKSEIKKIQYQDNREHVLARCAAYRNTNPDKVSAAKKRCYENKKDQYRAKGKADYQANRESRLRQSAVYRRQNKAAKAASDRAYVASRMKEDHLFRLTYSVRNRILMALRGKKFTKTSSTAEMLGCNFEFLKAHIESQFLPGMTWEDRSAWHIDHRIPLASATTEEQMKALCHYSNLRPMWATDNIRKGAKMEFPDRMAA